MRYEIVEADIAKNKNEILTLWKNFSDFPRERYRWLYENQGSVIKYLWLAKELKNGILIGTTGLYRRKFIVKGKPLFAGVAVDFFVKKDHRAFGPAINLQKKVISKSDNIEFDFILGFPNKNSEAVHLRVGYVPVADIHKMVKPLRMEAYLKKIVKNRYISNSLSYLLNPILRIVSRDTWCREKKNLIGEMISSFDGRFDQLWNKVSGNFGVIGERTSAYMTWRYLQCPFKKYEVFTLIEKETRELLGYIVFYIKDHASFIADLLAGSEAMLVYLLARFIRLMRKRNVNSIKHLGCESLTKTFKKFGFVMRKEDSRLIIYIDQKNRLAPTILRRENWYFLEGDGDT